MSELVPRQGGQPTKCTPQVIETICSALEEGMSASGAFRMANVDPNCLYGSTGWRARAERGEEPFRTFMERATVARAKAEQRAVRALVKGFDKDWRAAASWLARQLPTEWGEKIEVDMNAGPNVDPMEGFRAELEVVLRDIRGETNPEDDATSAVAGELERGRDVPTGHPALQPRGAGGPG